MPSGGQISSGVGLRLQPASPGVQDTGNANISGTMIASQFTTAPSGTGVSSAHEIFGHGMTPGAGANQVLMGINNNTSGGAAVGAIGYQCSGYSPSGAAFGINCTAGVTNDPNANKVAFGSQCSAGSSVGSAANAVAFGYLCNADQASSVAMGANVTLSTTPVSDAALVSYGKDIRFNRAGHREIASFGKGITDGAIDLTNLLVMGYYGGAASGAMPTLASNMILIGNPNQTLVQIGPYFIGNSTGPVQKVADANVDLTTSKSGTVIYTSITAARTVQLPAANSVNAGYSILVNDSSGNASGVNTITLNRAGADTINGGASTAINSAYGCRELQSDGTSKWTIIRSI